MVSGSNDFHRPVSVAKDTAVRCPFAPVTDGVDLVDPDLYGSGDPHAIWAEHRRIAPVRWQSVGTDRGFWSVTRYADVSHVLREHETFSSQQGTLLNLLGASDPASGGQMAATDPPRHGEMREPLQRALSIRAVEHYQHDIRTLLAELLGPLADGGPFDLAAAMSSLPMAVTGTMMAIPRDDWPQLTWAATAALAPEEPAYQLPSGPEATLRRARREIFAYFQDVIASRRKHPGDCLIDTLLGVQVEGRSLTDGQIAANCYSLLVGATLTTPQVILSAVAKLAGTGELDRWAANPDLMNTGIEEAIRWASPTNHFMRHTLHDTELAGVPIRSGDAVVVWLGSANRDERVFTDPFHFDIARKPNKHIAFGVGPHFCIGHTIARVILRNAFSELLGKFTGIDLASEPVLLRSNIIAGIRELRIIGHPRPTPAPIQRWESRQHHKSRQVATGGTQAFGSIGK
jgi:cytochrome P450